MFTQPIYPFYNPWRFVISAGTGYGSESILESTALYHRDIGTWNHINGFRGIC